MPLRPFFEWCDATAIGSAIRDSRILFPIIEGIHILALAVLLGTVILVSLRLMGVGLVAQPVPAVARTLAPMRNASLAVIVATGILLFLSEAMKAYESPPFFYKMCTLALAIAFQYTAVRFTTNAERPGKVRATLVAVVSLGLWFGVGVAGRAIGFY